MSGSFNESAEINLNKYAWQYGTASFQEAIAQLPSVLHPVNYSAIRCSCLFLVAEGEGAELKCQARAMQADLTQSGVDVTVRGFSAEEGADSHCELNNLRLLHQVVFD